MFFRLFNTSFLVAFCASILLENAAGQRWKLRRYEIGGGLGVTQVFGDIGGTIDEENWYGLKDIQIDETRLAFPVYLRYRLDPRYVVKFNGVLGFGHGSDEGTRNDRGRSYKTTIFEISTQGEYYFLAEERRYKSAAMFNRRGMLNNYMSFSGYVFLGLGGVYSKAKITQGDEWNPSIDSYKANNFGMVVPFGLGFKYIIDDNWLVGTELGYRISITDYIEGYSQIEGSKHNDVYYFLNLTVGYKLNTTQSGVPALFDRDYRMTHNKKSVAQKRKPKSKKEALK
jgi:OmpA-OmpF porin, OOP family